MSAAQDKSAEALMSDAVEAMVAIGHPAEVEALPEGLREVEVPSGRKEIEKILKPYSKAIAAHGLSVRALSDYVQGSAKGAKNQAKNKKHLMAQLGTLRTLVLSVAGEEVTA